MARIHKKEVYHFTNHLKEAKTFGQFLHELNKFGAREIGEGGSRKAWVWGNYVVKASCWEYDEDEPDDVMIESPENKSEIDTYRKSNRHFKKMMAKTYSELSAKNASFVVMEYVPNDNFRFKEIEKYQAKATRISKRKRSLVPDCIITDAHDGNFRKRANGQLVMIDLQGSW